MKTIFTSVLQLVALSLLMISVSSIKAQVSETVSKHDDTTKIKIGNVTIIFNSNDEDNFEFDFENEKSRKSKDKNFEVKTLVNLGMNGWLTADNQTAFPTQYTNMGLNYSRSRLFGADFMLSGLDVFKKHLYLAPGLGISWNNYHFNEKINITTGSDTTMFLRDSVTNFTKYKFRNTYLSIPLVIGTRLGNVSKKHFNIQAGIIGSFNIGNMVKQKYRINGTNNKEKIKDDFNINPFKLEAIARVNFGNFGIYGKYSFTEQFQPNKTQSVYPFSIGVTFGNIGI